MEYTRIFIKRTASTDGKTVAQGMSQAVAIGDADSDVQQTVEVKVSNGDSHSCSQSTVIAKT